MSGFASFSGPSHAARALCVHHLLLDVGAASSPRCCEQPRREHGCARVCPALGLRGVPGPDAAGLTTTRPDVLRNRPAAPTAAAAFRAPRPQCTGCRRPTSPPTPVTSCVSDAGRPNGCPTAPPVVSTRIHLAIPDAECFSCARWACVRLLSKNVYAALKNVFCRRRSSSRVLEIHPFPDARLADSSSGPRLPSPLAGASSLHSTRVSELSDRYCTHGHMVLVGTDQ